MIADHTPGARIFSDSIFKQTRRFREARSRRIEDGGILYTQGSAIPVILAEVVLRVAHIKEDMANRDTAN